MRRQFLKYLLLAISTMALHMLWAAPPRPEKVSYRSVHPNGKTHEKGHLVDNKRHGIWFSYNDQGLMQQKVKWKNGDIIWQVHYNEAGKVSKTINRKGEEKLRPACGC